MAQVKAKTWQMILGVAAVFLLIGWIVSGHLITGLAALVLLIAMGGGALLYRLKGPPER